MKLEFILPTLQRFCLFWEDLDLEKERIYCDNAGNAKF